MEFDYTPEQIQLRKTVREFAEEEIGPHVLEWDEDQIFPMEAIKHAQEGAGVITSLTETDGLVELPEGITTVAPGATVGFLSYAALAA